MGNEEMRSAWARHLNSLLDDDDDEPVYYVSNSYIDELIDYDDDLLFDEWFGV